MSVLSIHEYSSTGSGSVNSFILETETALIAIDAQRQRSFARSSLEAVAKLGKPLVALLLTHEHPDHHGGASEFLTFGSEGLPIYGLQSTAEAMQQDERGFIRLASQILAEDFSQPAVIPTHMVGDGDEVDLPGVTLRIHDLGRGESSSMCAYEPIGSRLLFCGDVVANRMTPFLFEGRSRLWLEQLRTLPSAFGHIEKLYCGHGAPASLQSLVPAQTAYILNLRKMIEDALASGPLTEERVRTIRESIESAYPGYEPVAEIPNFIEANIAAVAAEMHQERGQ